MIRWSASFVAAADELPPPKGRRIVIGHHLGPRFFIPSWIGIVSWDGPIAELGTGSQARCALICAQSQHWLHLYCILADRLLSLII